MIYLASNQVHEHGRIDCLKELLKEKKIDYIHIQENGISSFFSKIKGIKKAEIVYILPCNWPIFTILLAKLLGKKIITEFYFSWYDASINDWKKYSQSSLKAKILKFIDYTILNFATEVIFLNETEAQRYKQMILNNKDIKYRVIPLAISEKGKVLLEYYTKKREEFNVCWWGGYIPLHGLDKIIKAMKLLENEKIKLYIFGTKEERSVKYRELVRDLNLKNCCIDNKMSFKNGELEPFLIKNCDLALGGFGDSKKINEVILNKTLDIFSMKGICLTAHSFAMDEYFKENESVFYCEKTPKDIAQKILDISKLNYSQVKTISENSYKIYREHFTKKNYKKKVWELLNEI